MNPTIGVLALQGDVREHLDVLRSLGADPISVRRPAELAVCDGAWHTLSGQGSDFAESSLASGYRFVVEDVPAAGVIRFDDFLVQRRSPLARVIDNACPVASMRCDWADGVEEEVAWLTDVQTADDGT